jgi:hypothetical protein
VIELLLEVLHVSFRHPAQIAGFGEVLTDEAVKVSRVISVSRTQTAGGSGTYTPIIIRDRIHPSLVWWNEAAEALPDSRRRPAASPQPI